MYYEFYLDVYFLENLTVNCLILLLAGRIQKERLPRMRLFAAAVCGAAASCAAVVLPIHRHAVSALLLSVLLLLLMSLGAGGVRRGARMSPAVLASAMLLAAVWQILMEGLKMPFYLAVPAGYLGVSCFWKFGRRLQGRAPYLYDVTLLRGGRQARLRGLLDSGNCLVQPGTARPVHIVDYERIKELLDEQEQRELSGLLNLEVSGEPSGQFMYVPYRSIGDGGGVLPAVLLDEIRIEQGENAWSTKGALAAVSRRAVSGRGEYQIILHPRILE